MNRHFPFSCKIQLIWNQNDLLVAEVNYKGISFVLLHHFLPLSGKDKEQQKQKADLVSFQFPHPVFDLTIFLPADR